MGGFRIPLAFCWVVCYSDCGATSNGRRLALFHGGSFLPPDVRKGVLLMVTYSDLIQIGILIVGIIGLFFTDRKQK